MRRHLLALGVGALCLTLPDLALGAQSNTTAAVGTAGATDGTGQTASGGLTSQSAGTTQLLPISAAPAVAAQVLPVNVHIPVRLLSPGDDGQTDQANAASATSTAANASSTTQAASGGDPAAGGSASQSATTAQVVPVAAAASAAPQVLPVNADIPVRVLSPGDGGQTDQANAASAAATAASADGTTQHAGGDTWKGAGGRNGRGSASQSATTGQLLPTGLAPALAPQPAPLDVDVPVRAVGELPKLPIDPFAVLADPVGAATGALGTVTGLVASLPLPALPALPVDPAAVLGDPVGTVTGALGDPLGTVTGLLGGLPLDPLALPGPGLASLPAGI